MEKPNFFADMQRITRDARLKQDQENELARQRCEEKQRQAEIEMLKTIEDLEHQALIRSKDGQDWMEIDKLDTTSDISQRSWEEIRFDVKKLDSSMVVNKRLKQILDHFKARGFRIIFGEYHGSHDYFDPDYVFAAISWGSRKSIYIENLF